MDTPPCQKDGTRPFVRMTVRASLAHKTEPGIPSSTALRPAACRTSNQPDARYIQNIETRAHDAMSPKHSQAPTSGLISAGCPAHGRQKSGRMWRPWPAPLHRQCDRYSHGPCERCAHGHHAGRWSQAHRWLCRCGHPTPCNPAIAPLHIGGAMNAQCPFKPDHTSDKHYGHEYAGVPWGSGFNEVHTTLVALPAGEDDIFVCV
jgi:hypothetical protein